MVNNIIGETIRKKRKELNLTQEKLAELIESDAYYISRIETGKKKPGPKFLLALSNALDIPVDYLMGLESKIVLHGQVSELEKKMEKLSENDKKIVLLIMEMLIDRFTSED